MAINNFGGGGGGGLIVAGDGNGVVVKIGSDFVVRDLVGVYPIDAPNPTGGEGPLVFSGAAQRVIAKGRFDGTLTTDQVLEVIGADRYIVRSVIFTGASATPGAMAGGVYTAAGKTGNILVPAATTYATLDAALKTKEVAVNLPEAVTAPFIFVSLTTPNGAPINVDVFVLGDVLEYATA